MGKVGTRGRLLRAAVIAAVGAALLGVPLAASANPDVSGFELDGNAASSGAADWNSLGSPLDFTGFIDDKTDASDVGYGSGSNKDTGDVSTWSWAQGDVTPNKDDIVSAYASVYEEGGNLILYFGQTRLLDKSGDANVGFWFLQNPLGLNANGSFSGSHVDGDILIQSEFTNGGDVSGVQVYEWQGGSLNLVSSQAECTGGKLGTADACAIVNTDTISTDWAGSVTAPYFFEGGLDLSALFPQQVPCFSSFLTNTRTSQSETAELKDFALGDIDTCGSITVEKVTVPSGGGPFSYTTTGNGLSGFDLSGGGEKQFTNLQPGSYSVTEGGTPSAWTLDSLSCTKSGPGTDAQIAGSTANITLGFLGNVVCTYTNKRQPLLTLVKNVVNDNGGSAAPGAWTLGATGSSGSFSGVANTPAVTSQTVTAGVQYTLAESGGPAAYSSGSWVCTGGGSFAGPDKITLGLGDDVTCTITNDDAAPKLTLVKEVVNDDGGNAQPSAWTLAASGPTSFSGKGPSVSSGASFDAGTYDLSESGGPSGYDAGAWVCTPGGNQVDGDTVSVGLGDDVTCTITNDDRPATLTVVKELVNDNGGSKQKTSFSFDVTGPTASQNTFFDADGSVTKQVDAGTYTVTEDQANQDGYTTAYSNCSGVVLPPGGSATCTITNDDRPATLVVKKVVVNDDGGSKVASDFSFEVNQGGAQTFEGDGQNDLSVSAGTYTVTEPAVAGYTASYDGCSNIVLAIGQTKTCTITNDDLPATLTVVKNVVNDNGGTAAASAFTMTINGVTAAGGNSFPGASGSGVTKSITSFGAYDVTESTVAGYAQTGASADCSGTIALGQHKTCTITNDDVAPKLTLVKEVVNDDGGNAQPSAWMLAASGPTSFSGKGPSVSSGASFDAGTYDLSESGGPSGYDAGAWVCTPGGNQVDGDTVSVGLGDDVTCTITNDDRPATLVVKKVVVNDDGGTKVASDFSFQVNGGQAQSFEADGQNDLTVDAGTYDVTEPAVDGYATSYDGCSDVVLGPGETATCTITNDDRPATLVVKKVVVNDDGGTKIVSDFSFQVNGGQAQSFEGDGQNELTVDAGTYDVTEPAVAGYDTSYDNCSQLVIPNGGTATCTITNDDRPATLIVKKVVVNDNGGTKVASDFSFEVNGGQAQSFEANGQNDLTVDAGTYDVTEPAVAGYTTTYQGCEGIELELGGSATCTITNNDVPRGKGSITISKSADPTTLKEPGGPVTFSVTITNTSADVMVSIQNVVDNVFGDLDDDGGNGCFDVPVNLGPGDKVNCTFQKTITGAGGSSHVDVVTASGHDENGNAVSASDDARVDITERLIDLVVVKDATSPTPLNGIVNYTLTVSNRGPDAATNVQLADPAPAGITYLSASPSQGTCNVGPSMVTCALGTIAAGQTVTVAVTARATTVGSHTNTATVTGSGGKETNPADNTDSAVTIVPAPLKPPVVKPKPKPAPTFCLALTVKPKMVKADGKVDRVVVKVTAGKKRMKGVKVVVSGAGLEKSATTNRKGVAVIRINPRKSGLITVTAIEKNQRLCGPKRIGVVGVFLPPLTG